MNSPTFFMQLQARYPNTSLITEVVQKDTNCYVVRAIAQIGSTILATSLAGAATVEQAEDQACLRLLNVLGISSQLNGHLSSVAVAAPTLPQSLSPASMPAPVPAIALSAPVAPPVVAAPSLPMPSLAQPEPEPIPALDPAVPGATTRPVLEMTAPGQTIVADSSTPLFDPPFDPPLPLDTGSIVYEPEPYPEPEDDAEPDGYTEIEDDFFAGELEPPTELDPPVVATPSKPTKSSRGKSSKTDAPEKKPVEKKTTEKNAEPDDLSSLIAMTDVEMDRVGWTKKQGRDYLRRTYSKQTRQELEMEELMDFLNYLRALPSVNGL